MRAAQRREVSRNRSCVWDAKLTEEVSLFLEEEQPAMAQKRHPEEEKGNPGGGEKRRKVPDLGSVVVEVMKMNALQKLLSVLEPQLRRVVKEEVEAALSKHLATMKRQCGKQIYPSSLRSLQLQFISKLSLPIFTGTKIESEDSSGISLALVDMASRKIVVSGPESLMKVEIVVLEGDFEMEEENWSHEEFKSNIVKEREGKRPLLSGEVFLDLMEGACVLGELAFTDNSSWTRSRKFRLGARVEDGYFNGIRVREAKSEAFMVKDHRGELYKKHYPPSLTDEVWRLEKIGKDGAFHKRLCHENVNTVKDFLTMLNLDIQRLRNILGTGMSAKMWDVTVEHARTCVMGSQVYTYYPGRQSKTGVAFNVVGSIVGVITDGQFLPVAELSDAQKVDAHKLVKTAYEHWEDVSPCNGPTATCNSSHASSVSFPHPLSDPFYQSDSFSFSSVLPCSALHTIDTLDSGCTAPPFFSPALFPSSLVFEESSNQTLFSDDQLHYFDASDVPLLSGDSPADLSSAVSGFLAASARGKVNRHWGIIISVLKWRFSIKRRVSLRRNFKP